MSNSNYDSQVQGLADFVAAEAEAARKSTRNQFIVLAVVSIILIVYFVVANSFVKKWTEPKELARQGAVLLDENVPTIAQMVEGTLKEGAPQLADFIANKAVKEGIPYVIKTTEGYLNGYTDKMSSETARFMEEAFSNILKENKAQFVEVLKNNQTEADPAIAMRPLKDALKGAFANQLTGRKTESGLAIERSLNMLRNMNSRLAALVAKDPKDMTRREKQAARLLKMQWQMMRQRTSDDVHVEEKPGTPDLGND